MKHQSMKTLLGRSVLVAAMLALVAGSASAATYDLRAGATTVDHGNGAVPAWGYALVSTDVPGVVADNVVRVPGPTIYVPAGQDLTINLLNNLGESTSIVIQGQRLTGAPQFNGAGRVTAFTDEAGATAGTASYFWSAAELKTGTFLYNSGSHPSKQVHMGLYGAVVVDADATGCTSGLAAYPGVCYDRDIVIIYSEVDTDLRIAEGSAQALNFKPKFFLVNGDPTGASILTDPTPADLNSRVLLRFVNAGLKGYVPTMLGEDLGWIAEDGNPYPHTRNSYSAFLAAGKTMDAIGVPLTFDRHTLYDRGMHMSHNGRPFGGLRAFLDSANTVLPTADAGLDQFHVPLTPSTVQLTGGPATGVTYEWALIGFPAGSAAALSATNIANPTFELDVPGTYTAQLVVNDGTFSSAPDSVSIFTNLPPVAAASVAAAAEQGDVVDLVGSASYDPDADLITSYEWLVTPPVGLAFAAPSGEFSSFTASQTGSYTVELTVSDGELTGSDTAVVMVSVPVTDPPVVGDDYFQVIWKTTDNVLTVLSNDSAGDNTPPSPIVPSTVVIVTNPTSGSSAVPAGDGTILYTPRNGYKGTDFFTYEVCDTNLLCSEAEVLVNVVK